MIYVLFCAFNTEKSDRLANNSFKLCMNEILVMVTVMKPQKKRNTSRTMQMKSCLMNGVPLVAKEAERVTTAAPAREGLSGVVCATPGRGAMEMTMVGHG